MSSNIMLTINKSNIGGLLLVVDKFSMLLQKCYYINLFDVRIGNTLRKY